MNQVEWTKRLEVYKEEGYKQFQLKLIPGYPAERMIGVRIPVLRRLARGIAKQDADAFLAAADFSSYEAAMLYGMVIGYAPLPYETRCRCLERLLPHIDNWSVCDSVCNTQKFLGKTRAQSLPLIQSWIASAHEYTARFGLVALLNYYIDEQYIDHTLSLYQTLEDRQYYFNMAAAWLFAECALRYPLKSQPFVEKLPPEIQKMALRKMGESLRNPAKKNKRAT